MAKIQFAKAIELVKQKDTPPLLTGYKANLAKAELAIKSAK